MKTLLDNIRELFAELVANPENADLFATKLKDTLNSELGEENRQNFKPIECRNVFVSRNNGMDPFYLIVIPEMPNGGDSILTNDYLYKYDIDIDIDNVLMNYNKFGLNSEELSAWFMHELYANMLTDTTFLRYKRLLITYYDTRNKTIVSAHNNLGYLCWFGVFGNTIKEKISETTSDYVSNALKMLNIAEEWNSALDKFVSACGGDYEIITRHAVEADDKACCEQFNKLARKYSAYAIKYANTDYKTLVRYLTGKIGSELLKFCIEREPEHIAAIPEKDVFNMFDTRRLLRESNELENDTPTPGNTIDTEKRLYTDYTNVELVSAIEELEIDSKNVYTMSDKLLYASKTKDCLRAIEDRIAQDPTEELLLELRERAFRIATTISAADVSEVSELEIR